MSNKAIISRPHGCRSMLAFGGGMSLGLSKPTPKPIGSMYGIYANIGGILMGSMLPYIAAPWIRHGKWHLAQTGRPDLSSNQLIFILRLQADAPKLETPTWVIRKKRGAMAMTITMTMGRRMMMIMMMTTMMIIIYSNYDEWIWMVPAAAAADGEVMIMAMTWSWPGLGWFLEHKPNGMDPLNLADWTSLPGRIHIQRTAKINVSNQQDSPQNGLTWVNSAKVQSA